jgi:hypothetical protein
MTKAKQSGAFKGHRFSPEINSYAVWAYFRFLMRFRDVEDILYKRGVIVSYETIRLWVGKFGHQYAKVIRRDRPAPSDKWHLDEVVITIRGKSIGFGALLIARVTCWVFLYSYAAIQRQQTVFFANCSSNTVNRASLLPTNWEVMGRPSGNLPLISTIVPTRD